METINTATGLAVDEGALGYLRARDRRWLLCCADDHAGMQGLGQASSWESMLEMQSLLLLVTA